MSRLKCVTLRTLTPSPAVRSTWNTIWSVTKVVKSCGEGLLFLWINENLEKSSASVLLMKVRCGRCICIWWICIFTSLLSFCRWIPAIFLSLPSFNFLPVFYRIQFRGISRFPHSNSFCHSQILYITMSVQWTFFQRSINKITYRTLIFK